MKFKELSIKDEADRFKTHLDQLNNNRIIFSGIFGIGKTYFIQKFFEQDEDYILIKLNPVNYSVTANQDIFELIKYDIAFQLLSKNVSFEKTNFNNILTGQFFLLENYKSVISNLIENLSKLDHSIATIVEPALKLGKQLKDYQESINIDEEKELKEFLNFFKDQQGTIREENNITVLLSTLISTLRETQSNKKIVLAIDDLDRIDPEHIFRLLNVFSAHFDFQELQGENKFGFDKVILICDIENIRGIYHSKYGADIDFSGYIDKFYSTEIYYYSLEDIIKKNIQNFLKSIKTKSRAFSQDLNSNESYIAMELQFILSFLIDSGALSLRSLISFLQQNIEFENYILQTIRPGVGRIYSSSTPIFLVLQTLEKIFGGKNNFIKAMEKAIIKFPFLALEKYGYYLNYSIGNLAMLADHTNNYLLISKNLEPYSYDILNYTIEYNIDVYNSTYGIIGSMTKVYPTKTGGDPTYQGNTIIIPYFQLLKNAFLGKNEIVKRAD